MAAAGRNNAGGLHPATVALIGDLWRHTAALRAECNRLRRELGLPPIRFDLREPGRVR
jgi:hypothetical protein